MMLTPEEKQELPVIICWKGEACHFQTDEKETTRLLCQIISDMNLMQNPKFVSFPLGEEFIHFDNEANKSYVHVREKDGPQKDEDVKIAAGSN